ncbi:hypothetical protein Cantr_02371 [Candida viswanathii]|uniref:Uncharacterized protein n=1 Tax=Candida viswanathii TaxID=5486 RepID=A0A367YPM6_9ASCO|nr:hypothetical protein Cantr_02371 [Candida viswanathii]
MYGEGRALTINDADITFYQLKSAAQKVSKFGPGKEESIKNGSDILPKAPDTGNSCAGPLRIVRFLNKV